MRKSLLEIAFRALFAAIPAVAGSAAAQGVAECRAELAPQPIAVDGDLQEWTGSPAGMVIGSAAQVLGDPSAWRGVADAAAELHFAYDTNHLYIAGVVQDDEVDLARPVAAGQAADCLELCFGLAAPDADPATLRQDDFRIFLMPLSERRPWWFGPTEPGQAQKSASALTGFRCTARRTETGYVFEAVIPWHHLAGLRPGAAAVGCNVVLHDHDPTSPARLVQLAWNGRDPHRPNGLGQLRFAGAGPLLDSDGGVFLSDALVADLAYLLAPVLAILVLVLLLRGWSHLRKHLPWLRPVVLTLGVALFALGWQAPTWMLDQRATAQSQQLDVVLRDLQSTIARLEQGTLASYRGNSRDRALMDLLAGRGIARQKQTSYRFLAQLAPGEFGPAPRQYPEESFAVRPYWLPLPKGRVETFQFDPPLRGEALYVVIGRPYQPMLPFADRDPEVPRLRVELDRSGRGVGRPDILEFDDLQLAGEDLGRELHDVGFRRLDLPGDVRSVAIACERGEDVRLVGLSLLPSRTEAVQPLFLGSPSLGGVLTDLRAGYPRDAGLELGPGAAAKVLLPPGAVDPAAKLWLFHRATYPGLPTANPGARVAEVVLYFRGAGAPPPRTLVLEHQVSVFYETVLHNTRDTPPVGSPAAVAFSWVDETQERRINMVYPVLDLPAGAEIEAIEFRNLADYRMCFRSVVFGSERPAAPQDPADSPLVRDGQEWRLRADTLARFAGVATMIYRDGRLSETTVPTELRRDRQVLPRSVVLGGDAARLAVVELPGGGRRATRYASLGGDGWDGAVLAVSADDAEWAAAKVSANLTGLVLCLLSSPLLLVLLSELLAAVTNLRIRLMAVLSVAALVPLGVLSLVLVQVLERGHDTDQREGMRQSMQSAVRQLEEQKSRLRASAQQWLRDLRSLTAARTEPMADAQFDVALGQLLPELQRLMAGQLPPEWHGGFLKLDWLAADGSVVGDGRSVVVGDPRLSAAETPARLDPGIYLHAGRLLLGVRSEEPLRKGRLALTVGRPVDAAFLSTLAPGHSLLLTDVRGYPIEAAGGSLDPERILAHGRRPAVMAGRERALARAVELREPVVERLSGPDGNLLCGCEELRDLQETPRALLVLAQADQRATLELAVGRIPVRAFFLLVAGMLVVLSAFLSFVVSSRISQPIERLELGALALSRGALETRVQVEEVGQIGRLTRTFNQMAEDLQSRLQDLQGLNRVIRDLATHLDSGHILDVLRRFCEQHAPADRVRVLLLDVEGGRMELHGGGELIRLEADPELSFLSASLGPFCLRRPTGQDLPPNLQRLLPGIRSVLGLPLLFGERCRGAVLLCFERPQPQAVDLDLLGTVVAQAAVALENAQLYRHAVQDPVTGAFAPEYFRRRVADEVSIAQQRGQGLALLGLWLGDGARRPRGLRRFAALLREQAPPGGLLCHAGAGRFELALPGRDRAAGESLLARIAAAWTDLARQLPENEVEERSPTTALVVFPEEAASTEFLFDALRDRLLRTPEEPAATEPDAALQGSGISASSPAMRELLRTLRRVAPSDLTILLEGETGTGKEVLTNLVHRWSRRAGGPLVKVHCAALSETLLASELFGHEKGAFTGADRRKVGRFEQADGGTIFLDEVGEIPLDIQVKLLRVLQEREIDRVGGTEPIKVDVRVIAATNRDIGRMVAEGRFREDLYYRLQGMVVRVPPLRERKQEIPALVEQFRREVVAAGQSQVQAFSTDAMDELFRRDWPGNVRELRNSVFRAMVLAQGEVVQLRDVLAALPWSPHAAVPVLPLVAAGVAGSGQVIAVPPSSPAVTAAVPPPAAGAFSAEPTAKSAPDAMLPRSGETGLGAPGPSPAAGPNVVEQLSPRLRQLYQLLCQRGSIGSRDHMAAAGVSERTSLRDLQQLVELGLAIRHGRRRGARYSPAAPREKLAESVPPGDKPP